MKMNIIFDDMHVYLVIDKERFPDVIRLSTEVELTNEEVILVTSAFEAFDQVQDLLKAKVRGAK